MMTTVDKLAAALLACLPHVTVDAVEPDIWEAARDAAEKAHRALAEYNSAPAAPSIPTDFRVSWEIDAFNATTPREAVEEAREAMLRAHTTATVFTVQAADGTVTAVDLSDEE